MTVDGQRKLGSWIDSFVEYTAPLASPLIFRKWAGISCVAGALERKVWTYTRGKNLYPNLYVVLVGPPGVGKSLMLSEIDRIWRACPEINIAPTSVTEASLIDSLNLAKRAKVDPGRGLYEEYNALNVASSEFGVLIPAYDLPFMNTLTSIYDGEIYEQRRRSKDIHIKIERPFLNLIAGTTPSSLSAFMPEGAWDQGFASRTIFVYSDESVIQPLFQSRTLSSDHTQLAEALRSDLRLIDKGMYGLYSWEPDAAEALERWHAAGCPPVPDHPKLQHYIIRRIAHLIKLCVVATASRTSELIITYGDVDRAMQWLIEAETAMPFLFRASGQTSDDMIMREALNWLVDRFKKTGAPVPRYDLVYYLKTKTKVMMIEPTIQTMVAAKMIDIAPGTVPSFLPSRVVMGPGLSAVPKP